jgi:hypothetical protein
LIGRGDAQIGPEDLLFATEKETILLAIIVQVCQRISGAGFRTDKYLRSLDQRSAAKTGPPFMKTNFRIGLPSHVTE